MSSDYLRRRCDSRPPRWSVLSNELVARRGRVLRVAAVDEVRSSRPLTMVSPVHAPRVPILWLHGAMRSGSRPSRGDLRLGEAGLPVAHVDTDYLAFCSRTSLRIPTAISLLTQTTCPSLSSPGPCSNTATAGLGLWRTSADSTPL